MSGIFVMPFGALQGALPTKSEVQGHDGPPAQAEEAPASVAHHAATTMTTRACLEIVMEFSFRLWNELAILRNEGNGLRRTRKKPSSGRRPEAPNCAR